MAGVFETVVEMDTEAHGYLFDAVAFSFVHGLSSALWTVTTFENNWVDVTLWCQ
jgi:hypothetical protein